MPSDYDKIREDNIREYGEGQRHLLFLQKLYTDRTHFIFELLQNAEDAGATRILFKLFGNRLEICHDGRPFNESDVRGVCGIGEGEKTGNLTKIGEFGIGFKSVYAYASAPEVHSGDEHFRIENYVRPYRSEKTATPDNPWTTLFILPFKPQVQETAYDEIARRLRNLSARTLLFLHKIKEIDYELKGGETGSYLYENRDRGNCREITVIGENNGREEDERWLIFERKVKTPGSAGDSTAGIPVEIGFLLENEDGEEKIARTRNSRLIVSFSTDKETHLGFLIQGPYRTTPARDNIPQDNDWNKKLVEETARLLTEEALPRIKEMGLLTVSLLEAMPVRMEDFPEESMFFPIAEAVRSALRDQELLPADNGTFVAARNAKLARGRDLIELLGYDQLDSLFGSENEIKWLTRQITQDQTPELRTYMLDELSVEEISPERFVSEISEPFLADQPDDWIVSFYEHAYERKALLHSLKRKPVVRLQDGSHVTPVLGNGSPGAYLAEVDTAKNSLPVVKAELTRSENARRFLEELGVPELDIVAEVIEEILPKYASASSVIPDQEHKNDIREIEKAYAKAPPEKREELRNKLISTPFILPRDKNKETNPYGKPSEMYFESDDLQLYFSGSGFRFINPEYPESAMNLFKDLGVSDSVRVQREKGKWKNFVVIEDRHGNHKRGLDGFDPSIRVDGLEDALSSPSHEKSEFIWNRIVVPNSNCIKGLVESSRQQTYEDSVKEEKFSDGFGRLLLDTPWLPFDGSFIKPCELGLEDLPKGFERDENSARRLGMKLDIVANLVKEGVIAEECAEFIKLRNKYPDLVSKNFEQFKKKILDQNQKPRFPEKTPSSPERTEEKTKERKAEASRKNYEPRRRSIRVTKRETDPDTLLRDWYTNDAGEMVCQMCEKEMPFRKRDGEYYFEAVEALSRDYFPKELEEQFLALCPLCAAKYKEFVKRDEKAMSELKNNLVNTDTPEISVELGDHDDSIRFVKDHFIRIKTIIS